MAGTWAMSRAIWVRRESASSTCFASGKNVDSAPTTLRNTPIGCASWRKASTSFLTFS